MKMITMLAGFVLCAVSGMAATPEFFVFDNGVGRGSWTPVQQAKTLRELGISGISYNYTKPADLAAWQAACKAEGVKIVGLYVHTFPDKPEQPFDPAFKEAIKMLKGSGTVIWMTLREGKDRKRNMDAECVKIVREIADLASAEGVRVAVYGHKGFYVETGADSARIVKLAEKSNVGGSINLCHEFLSGKGDVLDETIRTAAAVSTLASVNGVDVANKKYILRLDQGDFDVAAYLKKLIAAGYSGPVGLQCYSVPGDVAENLKANIVAWKKIAAELDGK